MKKIAITIFILFIGLGIKPINVFAHDTWYSTEEQARIDNEIQTLRVDLTNATNNLDAANARLQAQCLNQSSGYREVIIVNDSSRIEAVENRVGIIEKTLKVIKNAVNTILGKFKIKKI